MNISHGLSFLVPLSANVIFLHYIYNLEKINVLAQRVGKESTLNTTQF